MDLGGGRRTKSSSPSEFRRCRFGAKYNGCTSDWLMVNMMAVTTIGIAYIFTFTR